jgi:hypothetical protein
VVKPKAQGRIPVRLRRCPMVPACYKRAKCWKKCRYWNRAEKRCEVEREG